MGEEPSPDPLLVQRILERLFADRSQGIERSLDDYQAAFPGHEETVAAQYREVFALTEPRSASSVDRLWPTLSRSQAHSALVMQTFLDLRREPVSAIERQIIWFGSLAPVCEAESASAAWCRR